MLGKFKEQEIVINKQKYFFEEKTFFIPTNAKDK